MKLSMTPEVRRRYGESLWGFDPNMAVSFIARAWLEENDKLDAFQAAHVAWAAAEPKAINFMPLREAVPLLDRRDAAAATQRAELNRVWGLA